MSKSVTIKTTIKANGNNTGIRIPKDVVLSFGAGRRVPVKVTVGNTTYRNSIVFYGGEYLISLSADNRTQAGVAAGDSVDVTLELDTAPRTMELPEDFRKLLQASPKAMENYQKLSFSKQRAMVEPILQAKTLETREKRMEKGLRALS